MARSQTQLGHQMEAVEDVERVGSVLGDEIEVGLPHVGAEEPDLGAALHPEPGEERPEGFLRASATDPEQTAAPFVDLVDHGQVPLPV
jgi:hypothetical protein